MQVFSSTVAELYERAMYTGPEDFPAQAIQLVRRLISFDGAILGIGNADIALATKLVTDKADVNCMAESLRNEPAQRVLDGLLAPAFFEELDGPRAYDVKDLGGKPALSQLHDFALKHDVRQFLLHGDLPSERENARWIILYRVAEQEFQEQDVVNLQAIWCHLRQATAFNLVRALYRSDPHRGTTAMALVNSCGLIEVADKSMTDLLKFEWYDFNEKSLPVAVVSALVESGTYHGKRIEITGTLKSGYMYCIAKRIPLINALAPSELNVAYRFARGMTHKEIAAHLKVSPHTVRNQLAQVYQKLGVHGKVELARMMSNA